MKEAFLMKKRYLGIACAALVGGALVACGSGDVSKPSSEDEGNTVIFDSSYYVNRLDEATKACEADPVCAARMNGTSSVEVSSSSSSEIIEPESSPGSSSSVVPVPGSSSTQINFSSASVPTSSATIGGSSSSIVDDGTTLNGTCAPESTPIEKGAIAKWNFVRLTPAGMVGVTAQQNALFTWTMMGSSEGSFSAKGSQGGNTASATYPTSGDFTASLELDNGNKIQCSPLHVNGAKITGCECAADASTVDVASGSATAKWTVSGCTTDATITGYTWADATGSGTLAMATLSTKGETISPTVTVKNDDNTEVSVTCPAVKATDSSAPEYEIDANTSYTLEPGTYSILYACNANQYYQSPVNISASGGWDNFTVEYSGPGGTGTSTSSQQHNLSYSQLYGSWSGSMPTEQFTITIDHQAIVKCQ